ncbi:hypothetical protein VNI00_017211 [Paramarasmius palmivorus]|uniref:Uncharacterized protein n=1 Tax=Paramarasmius palmivorus TaxID=297713 RepID=A0AAW0B868_9AGAR
MSKEECRHWMVPELSLFAGVDQPVELRSWPTHIYTALRDWQVARGFDPSTTDFARACGYPVLEILGGKENDEQSRDQNPGISEDIEDTMSQLLVAPSSKPKPSRIPVPTWRSKSKVRKGKLAEVPTKVS